MADLAESGRHFAGTNTRVLLEHVEDQLGRAGVEALLAGAEETRVVGELLDDMSWNSYGQFRRLLQVAAVLLSDVGGLKAIAGKPDVVKTTAPEFAARLQSFGSPMAMVLATGGAAAGIYPVMSIEPHAVGATQLRWHWHILGGFEPFPELCEFFEGMMPLMVRLFGFRVVEMKQTSCQCRGDAECVAELRWDEADDLAARLELAHLRLELAESRLAAFQETVSDIVSVDDLDVVLVRIVKSAARAMQSPGFVLVVDGLPTGGRVYTEGVTAEEAEKVLADDTGWVSVDIVSTHRRYGRILAIGERSSRDFETAALDSYARLAATALDSAFALEHARRQARTAGALLQLSTSLAELSTAHQLAEKVARAMPDVIDCDCSVVLLVSDGVARVAAHYGFMPDNYEQIDRFELSLDSIGLAEIIRRRRDEVPPVEQALMDASGLEAMASAPIIIDEATIGILVAAVRYGSERILDDALLAERFGGLAGQAAVALRNGRLLDEIRHQSLHDPLTDLPNRALIVERVERLLSRARRDHSATAAMFIDLDGFKEINDTLGHDAGDELLQMVAARLKTTVRSSDTVGRLGGDEFVVLVDDLSLDASVEVVAERFLHALNEPYQLTDHHRPIAVGASIGIAVGDRASASELLHDADIALYHAKAAGKGCYRVFHPEMQAEVHARAQLAEDLTDAIVNGEFFLLYQPIIDLPTETTTGAEALLRWNHPTTRVMKPAQFIPFLEETGLIVEVGRWVLREACRQAAHWHDMGDAIDISVNVSVRQLDRADFVDDVRAALDTSGLRPSSLILEITETAIMHNDDRSVAMLRALKDLGVRISIDDFGTGYSSLAYLRQLPVDALKIDRSFIDGLADSPAAGELLHTLVHLGKSLRLETYAEGIKDRAQLDRLQLEGCQRGQGYFFARPLSAEALEARLALQRRHAVPRSPR